MRNTIKTAIILLIFLTQFIFLSSVFAQTPKITNGLNYLISTQNIDGSWGNDLSGTEILPSTVSVIETLQVLDHEEQNCF